MKLSHIIYIGAAVAVSGASAQDLSTEITVDRTVVPRERPATRPAGFLPEPYTPAVSRPSLFPSEYFNPSTLTPGISTLRPANWPLDATHTPYRGYASIGYFPALNIGANAGYRLIDTGRSSLGAWLQYSGAQYKATDYQDIKDTYKSHDFTIGINGRHCFNPRSVLSASADFSLGAQSRPWGADDTFSRTASTFRFDAGFESSTGRVAYAIGASAAHFGFNKVAPTSDYPKLRQTDLSLRGSIGLTREDGNSRWLGLDIESQILFTNIGPKSPGSEASQVPGSATLSATALRPFVSFDNEKGKIRLGLDLSMATGDGDATYRIAPNVFAAWTPSPQFMAYAKATGGQRLNPVRQTHTLLPWLLTQGVAPRTDIPYQARVGLQYGPWKGFNAEIFGQYAKAESAIMPAIVLDPKYVKSALGYYNIKGWQFGAELQYKFSQPYALRLAGTFSPSRDWYADLDRARFTLDAAVTASPIPALDITLSYQLRAGRHVDVFKPRPTPVEPEPTPGDFTNPTSKTPGLSNYTPLQLHNISSLNLAAAYRITPRLTAFARGENLLGHSALDHTGVGLQGIHGLAGIAYKF